MYNLTDAQEKEVKSFIGKLTDSMVKSNITKLFDEVFPSHRMTSEQLEKFLSFQNALPKEFQSYPQTFAQILKNPHKDTDNVLKDSTSHLKAEKSSGAKGKESEEVLHTLGVTDKKKAGTKADPEHELTDNLEPEKSTEMKGNKTKAQAAEEEQIIARNQDAKEPKAKEKVKEVVVIKEKKK